MKLKSLEHYKARARVARAMGHPSRLLILDALRRKEMCVCELTSLVGADQSTVSRHLATLKGAGLVEDRKEGVLVFYRLRVACLEGFFQCVESVLMEVVKSQQAVLR